MVRLLNLDSYFADCIVSAKIGFDKPRKEIFEYALNLAGNPKTRYMIGDNPFADVMGGKAAGMKTILVHNAKGKNADHICENLSEILDILL